MFSATESFLSSSAMNSPLFSDFLIYLICSAHPLMFATCRETSHALFVISDEWLAAFWERHFSCVGLTVGENRPFNICRDICKVERVPNWLRVTFLIAPILILIPNVLYLHQNPNLDGKCFRDSCKDQRVWNSSTMSADGDVPQFKCHVSFGSGADRQRQTFLPHNFSALSDIWCL